MFGNAACAGRRFAIARRATRQVAFAGSVKRASASLPPKPIVVEGAYFERVKNSVGREGIEPARAEAADPQSRCQPMTNDDMVARGRESFGRQARGEAYALLSAADHAVPLGLDDLVRPSLAAALIGKDADSAAAGARAHHESLRQGDGARAARCAFWVGFHHLGRGDVAQGLGWLSRAARVLDDRQLDCAERGYLLIPAAIQATDEGEYAAAYAAFTKAAEIAERFGERELATIARYGRGQALVRSGRRSEE